MPLEDIGRCLSTAGALAICLSGTAAAQSTPALLGTDVLGGLTVRAPEPSPRQRMVFVWDHRPVFRFGPVELSIRARVQADHRASDAPFLEDGESAFEIARKRVAVDGDIGGIVDFQVERELSGVRPWRDVYVNYSQFDEVQVQAGKFKLPFSVEETTSAVNLDFVYRSLAARYLAPGRGRGVMVHGRVLGRVIRYEAGVFEHDGDNADAPNTDRVRGDRTTVWRLSVQPLRRLDGPAADLQIGGGRTSSSLIEGFSTIRGRTALEQPFFASDYPVWGKRIRTGFDVRWRPGPFSFRSELIRLTEERREQSVEDTDLPPLRATGWYVSGSWLVTGEAKADGVEPRRPLFQGGAGAVEIAGRIEELRFDSGPVTEEPSTSPRAAVIVGNANRSRTFGVTWYLNRHFKIQFNLIRETLKDPEQGPLPLQPSFWSRVFRFQFVM
jgi:phosphate-selective porin